jgi:hypothetical protein
MRVGRIPSEAALFKWRDIDLIMVGNVRYGDPISTQESRRQLLNSAKRAPFNRSELRKIDLRPPWKI